MKSTELTYWMAVQHYYRGNESHYKAYLPDFDPRVVVVAEQRKDIDEKMRKALLERLRELRDDGRDFPEKAPEFPVDTTYVYEQDYEKVLITVDISDL